MPIWSNVCPPVSWSLFSIHKYWQILARWQERHLIVETGKGLLLLFLSFFCTNTFTFTWKIYVNTEFHYDQNEKFHVLLLLSIVVQLSSIIWLRCARQCQLYFGIQHIDMFMSGAIIFQLVTVYGIFAGFPQLPFGLKLSKSLFRISHYKVLVSLCSKHMAELGT